MKKNAFLSFLLVAGILLALFLANGYAPFGAASLAMDDARIQYLDFFLYYKDVLAGRNSIAYTFSKLLGGSSIALFSYYLASPLNLLVVFFPKTQILRFFDLLILLKASLAAVAFSVFLSARFPEKIKSPHNSLFTVFLSAGYGLSQYVLAQSANLMWLDGVIMLPLMLLGVYEVVNGREVWRLAVPVALSVLFNWYTAGMNCLFSAVWFVLEFSLLATEPGSAASVRVFFRSLLRWLAGMLIGLLCSAVLFVPAVYALTGSRKADLNFWLLLLPQMRCPLYVLLESSIYGARSTLTSLSLFCGLLPALALSRLFLSRKEPFSRKAVFALLLLFLSMMFCWQPLYSLFNLLENPESYVCRFSYLQVFAILFMAAWSLQKREDNTPGYLFAAVFYAVVLMLIWLYAPYENLLPVGATAAALISVGSVMDACHTLSNAKARKTCSAILVLLLTADLALAAQLQLNPTDTGRAASSETPEYIAQQQLLIQSLLDHDHDSYRISQTRNRWTSEGHLTANYDESLAYGYWSVVEYSSTAPAAQLDFIDRLGYRREANTMNIVNTSVLGADSFLGVRYVLTDIPVNGLSPLPEIQGFDDKAVYLNPYALPMVFRIHGAAEADFQALQQVAAADNPFEYQNALYSALLGEDTLLYRPMEYELALSADPKTDVPVRFYRLHMPKGSFAVYGNLPWENASGEPHLDLNGRDHAVYARWLSPSVFYVPTEAGDREATVTLSGRVSFDEGAEQFYALDLDLLKQVTDTLKLGEVNQCDIQNGSITVRTGSDAGDLLFLSVPADKGWKITLNGKPARPQLLAGLFYTIPLQAGENTLTMLYRIPYLTEGILLSCLGLGLLLWSILASRKRKT